MNPFDRKVVEGQCGTGSSTRSPLVLGNDGAGVVEAVGDQVTRFAVGDRIYGQFMKVELGRGSYADLTVATEASHLAHLPEDLSYAVAAAIPTSSMAAYNAVETLGLLDGQSLVINGATGGVGQSAIQFAAAAGARVIATASPDLEGFVRDLGADDVVDFTAGLTAVKKTTAS